MSLDREPGAEALDPGVRGFPTEESQAPGAASTHRILRTLRLRNENLPGVLGEVATAIGAAGGSLGDIRTIQPGLPTCGPRHRRQHHRSVDAGVGPGEDRFALPHHPARCQGRGPPSAPWGQAPGAAEVPSSLGGGPEARLHARCGRSLPTDRRRPRGGRPLHRYQQRGSGGDRWNRDPGAGEHRAGGRGCR